MDNAFGPDKKFNVHVLCACAYARKRFPLNWRLKRCQSSVIREVNHAFRLHLCARCCTSFHNFPPKFRAHIFSNRWLSIGPALSEPRTDGYIHFWTSSDSRFYFTTMRQSLAFYVYVTPGWEFPLYFCKLSSWGGMRMERNFV